VQANAKSWGSIERAKRLLQQMDLEQRHRGEVSRAKGQGRKRCLQRVAVVVLSMLTLVLWPCNVMQTMLMVQRDADDADGAT
jgi:hypothetical protein